MRVARDQAAGIDRTIALNGLNRVKSIEGRAVRNVRTTLWTVETDGEAVTTVTEVPADGDTHEMPDLGVSPRTGKTLHALALLTGDTWRAAGYAENREDLLKLVREIRASGGPVVMNTGEAQLPVDAIALHEVTPHRVVLYAKRRRQRVPVLVDAPGEPRFERPRPALRDLAFARSLAE